MADLLKLLNRRNFTTLFKAIRSEPLPMIWANFLNLVKGKSIASQGSTYAYAQTETGVTLQVDHAVISNYSDASVVYGWLMLPDDCQDYVLKVNGTQVDLWYYREDVHQNFTSRFSLINRLNGFIAVHPSDGSDSITIELIDSGGNSIVEKKLTLTVLPTFEHLPLHRNLQYGSYTALSEALKVYQDKAYNPLVSIIVPVYNVDIEYLKPCIQSVLDQTYPHWQLCLCDDASTRADTRGYLRSIEQLDDRIEVIWHEENRNISAASNSAIDKARGEFICLLDHDDLLHQDALDEVVEAINANPNVDIIYSDEDKLSQSGFRVEPYYKPQYSPHLLLANNYICHLLVIRKSLGDQIGWFREGYEGAQDHDLILRLTDISQQIVHIPKILYHWRKIEGSTALNHGQKSYANKAGHKALKDYLRRNDIKGKVKYGPWTGSYRIKYELINTPKIAIVIPFKDQVKYLRTCLSSIFQKTKYTNFEIILVDNLSEEKATQDYLSNYEMVDNVTILKYDQPFNYSKINNWAIDQTDADVVLLLNNDIKVITDKWLTKLYRYLQLSDVGAVGANLLYPDMTSQHSGLVMGIGGVAGHAFKGLDSRLFHYFLDGITRNVSGCTAACLMVYKSVWKEVGGLNQDDLKVAFNDVDFCLKIRDAGHQILYIPEVQLYHFESKSRGYEDTPEKVARFKTEENYMKETWGDKLTNDPYYSPNLTLIKQDYGLNMEGRIQDYLEMKERG